MRKGLRLADLLSLKVSRGSSSLLQAKRRGTQLILEVYHIQSILPKVSESSNLRIFFASSKTFGSSDDRKADFECAFGFNFDNSSPLAT